MKKLYALIFILFLFNLADILMSAYGLSLGAIEVNPMYSYANNGGYKPMDIIIKSILPILICLPCYFAFRRTKRLGDRLLFYVVIIGLIIFYVYVAVNNFIVIMGLV